MATLAQGLTQAPPPTGWLWQFLRDELSPYPGRAATVARMVFAATLVMIICETFRIPFAYLGAFYALIISRESSQATVRSAGALFIVVIIGAAYLLIGAWFVVSIPELHFLWNITSFFIAFYLIATLTNYNAAVVFAFMISAGIPLWDTLAPAEVNVELTLWILLSAAIGASVTVAVELVFVRTRPGYEIVLPIIARLASVRSVLLSFAEGRSPDRSTKGDLLRQRSVGTSRVRRLLQRSTYSSSYRLQMSGVAALTGRLVDIAATLTDIPVESSRENQRRARHLAAAVGSICLCYSP